MIEGIYHESSLPCFGWIRRTKRSLLMVLPDYDVQTLNNKPSPFRKETIEGKSQKLRFVKCPCEPLERVAEGNMFLNKEKSVERITKRSRHLPSSLPKDVFICSHHKAEYGVIQIGPAQAITTAHERG